MTKTDAINKLCDVVDTMREEGGYDLRDLRDAAESIIMEIDEI